MPVLKKQQNTVETTVSKALQDMDQRIQYLNSLVIDMDSAVGRLKKHKKDLDTSVLLPYSNEFNTDLFNNRSKSSEFDKLIELYTREAEGVKPLLEAMVKCREELAKADLSQSADAILPDGKINGYNPTVQKILAIDVAFSKIDDYAKAASWKIATSPKLAFTASGTPPFKQEEVADLCERGNNYITVLTRKIKEFSKEGGAARDYIDLGDMKDLIEDLGEVKELLDKASATGEEGDLKKAASYLFKAKETQQLVDENYNKVMSEAITNKFVWEEGDTYDFFKHKVAPYFDWTAFAAPVVGGLAGFVFAGPPGAAAGTKIGTNVSAAWWFYRGADGVITAAANNRVFSLECAESLAITLLSAARVPGAKSIRFVKPAQKWLGVGIVGSMSYHIGEDLVDTSERGWFFTAGQRDQYAFYGGIVVFGAANVITANMSLKARRMMGEFTKEFLENDPQTIARNAEKWLEMADNLEKVGEKKSAIFVREVVHDAKEVTGELGGRIPKESIPVKAVTEPRPKPVVTPAELKEFKADLSRVQLGILESDLSLLRSFSETTERIISEKPDMVMFPLTGAWTFARSVRLIASLDGNTSKLPPFKYPPFSAHAFSKRTAKKGQPIFENRDQVVQEYLIKHVKQAMAEKGVKKPKIMVVDEVRSGSSVRGLYLTLDKFLKDTFGEGNYELVVTGLCDKNIVDLTMHKESSYAAQAIRLVKEKKMRFLDEQLNSEILTGKVTPEQLNANSDFRSKRYEFTESISLLAREGEITFKDSEFNNLVKEGKIDAFQVDNLFTVDSDFAYRLSETGIDGKTPGYSAESFDKDVMERQQDLYNRLGKLYEGDYVGWKQAAEETIEHQTQYKSRKKQARQKNVD